MVITVTALLLMLCSSTGSDSQPWSYTAESEALDFGAVPAGNYVTQVYYDPGLVGILFQLARTFLHVIQPNPFPRELVIEVIKQNYRQVLQQYQEIIYYEIGFIICAALGIVFVLLMPILGLCFCMCRCCDNCGGELHQRQKKNADCRRSFFATTLLLVTVLITTGTLCMFAANQNLTNQVKGVKKLVNNNFQDLHTLLNQAPTQINYITQQYDTTKNRAFSDLNNIGSVLGGKVKARFAKDVIPALDASFNMARDIRESKKALENVVVSKRTLEEATGKLDASLTDAQSSLNNTLNDAACKVPGTVDHCDDIRGSLDTLSISADFNQLQDVDSQLAKVNNVLKTDFEDLIQKGHSSFNNTPEVIQNETKAVASDAKKVLNDVGEMVSDFSKKPAIDDVINTSIAYLNQGQRYFLEYLPYLEKYDFYRWLGGIALCCSVVLILTFNYLGLLCGSCGFDKHASPTTRGCVSNTGGTLLLAGVGVSFIFSWLLMLVVVVTFFTGGNVERLACQSFKDNSLFKLLDTPYLLNSQWKNFLSGLLFSEHNVNLTFQSVYSKCRRNEGVYSAFQLQNVFNVDDLNFNAIFFSITANLTDKFTNVDVKLSSIMILDEQAKNGLRDFTDTGIEQINFAAYFNEPAGALANALRGHANNIREIYKQQVVPLEGAVRYIEARSTLNQSWITAEHSSRLKGESGWYIAAVESAQYLIHHNGTEIVKQEIYHFIKTLIGYFTEYLEWAKDVLNNEVAICKPVANVVDTVDMILCGFIVDSLNGFWFSLGCCTIFLIPSIIVAVKLAKFYRRMDTEDVYDDTENIPMKILENGSNGYHNEHSHDIQSPVLISTPPYDTLTRFPRASAPPKLSGW
ncbi:LOW QUALITY PROTEIN: prominin-1-A-like [Pristis pectinata]|uniref:LOW QUALITY PROTEIN: prominin-1-A-like n=1 Tax=Pristis pectinata TaxID=685728 RepID=UPI00223CCDB4|nr:LOW QUALITY PROTEIN: prominin-1-A-like [Pristis pectinata]